MTAPRVVKGQKWNPKKYGQPIEILWTSGDVAEVQSTDGKKPRRLTNARILGHYELVSEVVPWPAP